MTDREAAAMQIVYRYAAVSAGAAFIPMPGLDVTVLAGIHVALIKRLCDHYDVDFSEHTARNLLIAIAASVIPGTVGSIAGRRVLAVLPPGLNLIGWTLMSASSAAFSYAIGRLFIHHFETGGTLFSFDTSRIHHVLPFSSTGSSSAAAHREAPLGTA